MTKETAPLLAGLWAESFAHVPSQVLQAAFMQTLRTCKWFPTVADMLSHIESTENHRAEDEWQNLLEYCRQHVYPDLGLAKAPKLPPDVAHAAAAAGGLLYLEPVLTDELQWAKKRFVEDLLASARAETLPHFSAQVS